MATLRVWRHRCGLEPRWSPDGAPLDELAADLARRAADLARRAGESTG